MQQDSNEASFNICDGNSGYVSTMDTWWQEGMVLSFSLWGNTYSINVTESPRSLLFARLYRCYYSPRSSNFRLINIIE